MNLDSSRRLTYVHCIEIISETRLGMALSTYGFSTQNLHIGDTARVERTADHTLIRFKSVTACTYILSTHVRPSLFL